MTQKTKAKTSKTSAKKKAPVKKAAKKPAAKKPVTAAKKPVKVAAKAKSAPAKKAAPAAKKKPVSKPVAKKKVTKPASEPALKKASAKPAKKTVAKKAAPKKVVAQKKTVAKKRVKKTATPKRVSTPMTSSNAKKETTMPTPQNFDYTKMSQEAANASRESVEAMIKSGTIWAKGVEEIMKTAASLTQTAAEKQAQLAKDLMTCKSLNEFAEKQNKVAQASFDDLMANSTKLSEMSVKLLNDASAPLNAQMTKAMSAAKKAA